MEGKRQEGMNLSRQVWAVEEKKDDHRLEMPGSKVKCIW